MSAIPLAQLPDTHERDAIVDRVLDRYGRVDVLVNNAGMVDAEPAIDEPLERFTDVLNVNLVAPFALAQRAAKAMLDSEPGERRQQLRHGPDPGGRRRLDVRVGRIYSVRSSEPGQRREPRDDTAQGLLRERR